MIEWMEKESERLRQAERQLNERDFKRGISLGSASTKLQNLIEKNRERRVRGKFEHWKFVAVIERECIQVIAVYPL